jgi:hypothetical protein
MMREEPQICKRKKGKNSAGRKGAKKLSDAKLS